ncbi:MAG: hypothetical protein J6C29_05470 [Clostridia bacterium]|nr:hypothetical protein [Clostridia bacterium]
MDKNEVLKRLKHLDMSAYTKIKDNKRYSCIIVGGGALMLLGFSNRVTYDIDVLKSDIPRELFEIMDELDINNNVMAYSNNFAENYVERAKPVELKTEKIDFYTVSLEDLIISKLAAFREKDVYDIMNLDIMRQVDYDLLDKLAKELKFGMLNDYDIKMFEYGYNDFIEKAREANLCGS